MTYTRGSTLRTERETVVGPEEFQQMLDKAERIEDLFFSLRAKALLCVLRLTGKRRSSVAALKVSDVQVKDNLLFMTFTVLKKRKANVLSKRVTKSIPLQDPYTLPILQYYEFLQGLTPTPEYFFPRAKSLFGFGKLIEIDTHISGRHVFNILREISEKVWPHLFRETAAKDEFDKDSSLIGAFRVMHRLDLESYTTGFNYLRRFATHIITREGVPDRQGEYVIVRH
ncbi:MAG: tyrosine-type recombinase/integrase [Nitrososphaeria archaeon]|nr:tyrosine-type recombinase/integrase [Nitrososphaeria archaeon]